MSLPTPMNGQLRSMTTVFLLRNDQILMLYRKGGRVVNQLWVGSAGGHFDVSDQNNAEICVLRELREELGISPKEITGLTLRYITLRNTAGEIRQNYYFFASLSDNVTRPLHSTEGECRWFPLDAVADLPMPVTAAAVLEQYRTLGHRTEALYIGVAGEIGVAFSPLPPS